MPIFLALPPEIRNLIYEYSLTNPQPLHPYDSPHYDLSPNGSTPSLHITKANSVFQRKVLPELPAQTLALGLLSTCKAIREECLPILFQLNTWNLPKSMHIEPRASIFYKYGHLIRSAILSFHDEHISHAPYLPSTEDSRITSYTTSGSELIPEITLKDMLLEMMPKLGTLVVNILVQDIVIPRLRPLPGRIEAFQEWFRDGLKVTVGKEVDVLVRWNYVSIRNVSEEEIAIVKAWRNKGLEKGQEGPFYVIKYPVVNWSKFEGMSKASKEVVKGFYVEA